MPRRMPKGDVDHSDEVRDMVSQELDVQVIIVGAGPVGFMLAGELRLAETSVVVVETPGQSDD
jgi:ribulose 1,5-bisphosphate synthetase/thiazole synthase